VAERGSLVRLQDEWDLALEWNGYELHPETPPGGIGLERFLPDDAGMMRYLAGFAQRFGIGDLRPPVKLANTRRVLAVAERARDRGRLDAFRAAAFDGYWRRGRDLEAPGDLRAVASEAGLSPEDTLEASIDPALLARVDAARQRAAAAGVTGVPTFDFGDVVRVVGCQPYEALVAAARRSGASRRPTPQCHGR
jgi:predicted DsbA family dithiol-disulfide isomerase